jgi:hypothetical protein
MRTMKLDVPVEAITEFAELVEENEIKNNITGVNEDGEIQIEIEYEREQRNGVMVILEVIEIIPVTKKNPGREEQESK